jgi:hypothetical protein
LREAIQKKKETIEKEMEYEEHWECEILEMLEKSNQLQKKAERRDAKRRRLEEEEAIEENHEEIEENHDPEEEDNGEMAKFFDNCKVAGPLEIKDAFFGMQTDFDGQFHS